jgi:hypothetical protein
VRQQFYAPVADDFVANDHKNVWSWLQSQVNPSSVVEMVNPVKDRRFATPLVIHNNFLNRMALRRRCFIQISALSTFDGRIEAYHGFDG